MRGTLTLLTEEAGDLLLVASLVLIGPSWVGGIELLSTFGVDGSAAAFLSGAYAWGRGALSAALLARNARRGSLAFGGAWLTSAFESITEQAPFTTAYPTPAAAEFSLCRTAQAV
jgi:hypothetical protein